MSDEPIPTADDSGSDEPTFVDLGLDEPADGVEPDKLAPDLKASDERHTLGHVVERQLAGLAARIGGNFKPGQPVKLFTPSMSGGDNYARQSQKVRHLGVSVGTWQGVVEAVSVLLSGSLLVLLVWLGTHELAAGRLTVGQLIKQLSQLADFKYTIKGNVITIDPK